MAIQCLYYIRLRKAPVAFLLMNVIFLLYLLYDVMEQDLYLGGLEAVTAIVSLSRTSAEADSCNHLPSVNIYCISYLYQEFIVLY